MCSLMPVCMYVYICIIMCIIRCVYVSEHTWTNMFICMCMYGVHIRVCLRRYIYVCMCMPYACMYIHECVHMCVCECAHGVCICVSVYMYAYMNVYICVCLCESVCEYMLECMCMYVCMHGYEHMVYMCESVLVCVWVCFEDSNPPQSHNQLEWHALGVVACLLVAQFPHNTGDDGFLPLQMPKGFLRIRLPDTRKPSEPGAYGPACAESLSVGVRSMVWVPHPLFLALMGHLLLWALRGYHVQRVWGWDLLYK